MPALPKMAAQRSLVTLGQVQLVPGQPVVGHKHQAGLQRLGQLGHEFVEAQPDLRAVALRQVPGQFPLQLVQRLLQCGVGAAVFPAQPFLRVQNHAPFQPSARCAPEALAGQGVEHFVGEDHAPHAFVGEPVHPLQAFAQVGVRFRQALPLHGAHAGRGLDQQVAQRERAGRLEFAQHDLGQPSAAGPHLDDIASRAGGKDFGALTGERTPEKRRCFRRGVEVSALADPGPSGAVIALIGVIKRQLHVAVERQPAAGFGNGGGDVPGRGLRRGCVHGGFI